MLKRLARWLGYAGGGLVAILIVVACVVYAWSSLRFVRKYAAPAEHVELRPDTALVARGHHLATAVLGCVGCHGQDLGGNVMFDVPPVARLTALNLTRGANGAAARYSSEDWEHAIRHGIAPDGRPLKFMPAWQFNRLGDDDLRALISYLDQVPPVTRVSPTTSIGPLGRLLYLTGQVKLISAEAINQNAPHTQAPTPGPNPRYGEYLTWVSGCRECHGETLSGGHIPGTPSSFKNASNLTPAGIGRYSEADFTRAMREGVRPGGFPIDTLMPVREFKQMSDDEIRALYAYLRTVPAREYGNR